MNKPIIPAPREPLSDPRNGAISRAWNLFLNQLRSNGDEIADAAVLTGDDQTAAFANSLILTPVTGELERLLDPLTFTLGLADAGTAGTDGSETETIAVTRDAKGRVTSVTVYTLESGNVVETTNLYFTDARARAAISGVDGIDYDDTTGVIDTTGFTGTAGPVTFAKGIAASGTAVAGFTGTVSPVTSVTFSNGLCTAAS